MNADELKRILDDHASWVAGDGGKRANLSGANLIEANLREANLREANLREAKLRYANLSEANLSGVKLGGANLSYANLIGANLRGANLIGANLRMANLSGVNLSYANLRGANLSYANLSYANLIEADGLNYAQCSFDAHGETGLQLSGVVIAGELMLFCGCFQGTLEELDAYIENGKECYKATRKLARDFVVAAIDAARKE